MLELDVRSSVSAARRGDALLALIGNTPLIPLYFPEQQRTIYAKCEFLNPSGSIKDRLARRVILDAEQRQVLHSDSVILECTSGNTGIALAMLGAARGYRVMIIMSERASYERRLIIQGFGAELKLFADAGYLAGIELSNQLAAADSRYFLPKQFENPLNAQDHEHETAVELLQQMDGHVDAFVSGYGTGGTLAGCSRALRRANPDIEIVAMEPAESALLSGEEACCHWIEGVAGGFLPPLMRDVAIDRIVRVPSAAALEMTRKLNREYGLLVGSSSGANMTAALQVASELPADHRVVTILCDRAERYFSTKLFAQ